MLWGYLIQWSALIIPPALVVSFGYLLLMRQQITNPDIRSHWRWQLTTCAIVAALIPVFFGLLFIGFAGFNTDSPLSIIATFLLVGGSFLFMPWILYRLVWGTMRFSKQIPMNRMFP